jgi:hypothetical protein
MLTLVQVRQRIFNGLARLQPPPLLKPPVHAVPRYEQAGQ